MSSSWTGLPWWSSHRRSDWRPTRGAAFRSRAGPAGSSSTTSCPYEPSSPPEAAGSPEQLPDQPPVGATEPTGDSRRPHARLLGRGEVPGEEVDQLTVADRAGRLV